MLRSFWQLNGMTTDYNLTPVSSGQQSLQIIWTVIYLAHSWSPARLSTALTSYISTLTYAYSRCWQTDSGVQIRMNYAGEDMQVNVWVVETGHLPKHFGWNHVSSLRLHNRIRSLTQHSFIQHKNCSDRSGCVTWSCLNAARWQRLLPPAHL